MSADWASGYIMDTLYTDGFYRELSPAWLNYVAALRGCWPIALDRPFTYLELGCGQGRSTAVFAGAFPQGQFIGVDLNPAHIALARKRAEKIGIRNVAFLERSFAELTKSEVPECDFIVMHGVYTWVNDAARADIRRIIREKLKPGGLVYLSYNALPGWAAVSPLRKLVGEFTAQSAIEAGDAITPALGLVQGLAGANFAYFRSNPVVQQAVQSLGTRDLNYLAHEFLNATWTLFYSSEVADEMADAKLNFLGSATLAENHVELLVDKEAANKIGSQPTPRRRELLLDFAINQRFRRDIFVRGHQQLSETARAEALGSIVVGSTISSEEFTPKATISGTEITFAEQLFPIVRREVMGGPKSIDALRTACRSVTTRMAGVDYLVATLLAAGHLSPFVMSGSNEPDSDLAVRQTNEMILGLAISTRSPQQLISLQAGTGIDIDPVEGILIRLQRQGADVPETLEVRLLRALDEHGLRLSKAGSVPKSDAAMLALASEIVAKFQSRKWPALVRLGL